jgi:hypothetical protein
MVCPFCSHDIAAAWQLLGSTSDELGRQQGLLQQLQSIIPAKEGTTAAATVTVIVRWLLCQNTDCRQIVVAVTRNEQVHGQKVTTSHSWLAVPKEKAPPVVNLLVPQSMREDYIEAWTILDDSPRMSSVLSRRILADLLKKCAAAAQYGLAARIDAFVKDTTHPSRLRDNLHYLREIADFSAHTQTTAEEEVIEVTDEEAQWTLKVVADLFDYFIVAPKKDEALRASFDKKLEAAGRKRIPKPPNDPSNPAVSSQ